MIQSRQVEAFRAVMMTGAMTAAADVIHVTQPAVSRLIRDLEAQIGFPLFVRRGNLVEPTERAHALLEEVERSFVGLGHIKSRAEELRRGLGITLRVGSMPAISDFFARYAAQFARAHPQLHMRIESMPSTAIREGVIEGVLDVGVTLTPFRAAGLHAVAIEDEAVVAMPAGHPLETRTVVGAADLAGEDLVLLAKFGPSQRHSIGIALQGIRTGRLIETEQARIACRLAAEGLGIAIVDPFSAGEFAGRGVTLRKFVPRALVGAAVVHSATRPLKPVAEKFRAGFIRHATEFVASAEWLG